MMVSNGQQGLRFGPNQHFPTRGDWTLPRAIVSMAEREVLAAKQDSSPIRKTLSSIQWLLHRSRGFSLQVEQAIELESLLQQFCGKRSTLDPIMEDAVTLLQVTNPPVAQFIQDWEKVECDIRSKS